jgi:hypothetical protein
MKSVQFKLSEEKYEQAKKKLQESGLTWQMVCEQMSDYVICSETLDEFGLPIQEMAPSVMKKAKSEAEGHLETALWKYIQIKLDPSGDHANHWMQGLKAALKQLLRSNSHVAFKRGYFFEKAELELILAEMFPLSVQLAAGHLGLDAGDIRVKKPSIDDLFQFAGVPFQLKLAPRSGKKRTV